MEFPFGISCFNPIKLQCDQSLKLEIRPIFAENSHIYSPDFQPQFFPPHFPPQQKNRDFEAKMSLLFVFFSHTNVSYHSGAVHGEESNLSNFCPSI